MYVSAPKSYFRCFICVAKVLAKYIQEMNDDILGTESSVGNCLQRSEIKDIHIFI